MKGIKTSLCLNYNAESNNTSDKIPFIGPRALFDPNFIPPIMIPREKRKEMLQGIILDAIEDHYATNVNLFGLTGIGKNLVVNSFLQNISIHKIKTSFKKSSTKNHDEPCIIRVDCAEKEIEQIFFIILNKLSTFNKFEINIKEILNSTSAKLWNSLKLIISKMKCPIILFLQKSENLKSFYLTKFYNFAKNSWNLQLITTMNTGIQRYSFKQYEGMDHRIQMNIYESKELQKITHDRSVMAFEKAIIEPDAIDLIVDYISEYDIKVPGACMNLLKELYPIIYQNDDLTPKMLRNTTQYFFDSYNLDAVTFADFVISTSIEERLFLEYLVSFFRNDKNFYIPFSEIKQAYSMSCEELGYDVVDREFLTSLKKITQSQVICPSRIPLRNQKTSNGVHHVPHFLTLPVDEVNALIAVSFGMKENDNKNYEF